MRVGVYDNSFRSKSLAETLDVVESLGLTSIELGTGAYSSAGHCDVDRLLGDAAELKRFRTMFDERGIVISALSQHGNPLSPNTEFAEGCHRLWLKTARLAAELEVGVVNAFSGCPGDNENAVYPNWVTCTWPAEFSEVLVWQWESVAIPYWVEQAKYALSLGVSIGIEMHPGFLVYNPETLLRLRAAAGPAICANFDPSHLFWQGIDPVEAIRMLGADNAIVHVHAKDTFLDHGNIARNGVLDTKPFNDYVNRSWTFRTVGYGAGEKVWHDMVSMLRTVGYDHVLSIEHEDGLVSFEEGLSKAAGLLNSLVFRDPAPQKTWWTAARTSA